MRRAILAIDPGITTGWALLDPSDGSIMATSVWGTGELRVALDALVRVTHSGGWGIRAVIETMPAGAFGELQRKLEEVRRVIAFVLVETYDIPCTHVAPGTWKPSRAARTWKPVWRFAGSPMTIHQRDAVRMGLYVIDKEKEYHGETRTSTSATDHAGGS